MASDVPLMLTWFPQSEDAHAGIPSHCQSIIQEHFRILWIADLLANPHLGSQVQVSFGSCYGDPVLRTVQHNPEWFPNLKVLITFSTAYDHLNLSLLKQHGIRACNTVSFSEATAEHALLLLLATARDLIHNMRCQICGTNFTSRDVLKEHMRQIHQHNAYISFVCEKSFSRKGDLSRHETIHSRHRSTDQRTEIKEVRKGVEFEGSLSNPAPGLLGSTLGIIGLGRIGLKVARSARLLNVRILYHKRNPRSPELDNEDGFVYVSSLESLLSQSDYLLIACPLSSETRGLLGWKEFKQMKSTAALINVARAEIIDNDALLRALQSGELRSAALDVTDPHILPTDHPLLSLPNVIVTNHCGFCTHTALALVFQEVVHNAVEGLAGRPMPNEIKPDQ